MYVFSCKYTVFSVVKSFRNESKVDSQIWCRNKNNKGNNNDYYCLNPIIIVCVGVFTRIQKLVLESRVQKINNNTN